jgi:hypothetical protein
VWSDNEGAEDDMRDSGIRHNSIVTSRLQQKVERRKSRRVAGGAGETVMGVIGIAKCSPDLTCREALFSRLGLPW